MKKSRAVNPEGRGTKSPSRKGSSVKVSLVKNTRMKSSSSARSSARISKAKLPKMIITAALPYANGSIHVGHLLEYIQADIYARFCKLVGKDVLYICASDMHGTPIEVNAQKAQLAPEIFVERYWKEHQEDFASFLIRFDNYYKTHSPENKELAEKFFATAKEKGHIYRKKIPIMYCTTCKRSLPDRYVKGICPHCRAPDQYGDVCEKCSRVLKSADLLAPRCALCGTTPKVNDSEHYFFRLSAFAKPLQKWSLSEEADLQPEVRNWLAGWFEKGLDDWCISRDAPYFGFEIPNSRQETGEMKYFYVWLDAPIGYISSTKEYCVRQNLRWEDYWRSGKTTHFIGKDIAYFHLLFWPALLMDMDIPLPKIRVHGFITVNGEKMSKSRGTFMTAKDFLNSYSAEALRFFYASHLDRSVVDVDLNREELEAVVNNVLLGSLGNFCYRTLVFAEKNYGRVSAVADETDLIIHVSELLEQARQNYEDLELKSAVRAILKIADLANAYFQKAEPWKNKERPETKEAIGFCVNLARTLAIAVSPILPLFSQKIFTALGDTAPLQWKDIHFQWKGKLSPVEILVGKIESKPKEGQKTNSTSDQSGNATVASSSHPLFPAHLAVGLVEDVKDHPNADSLYLLHVNFGDLGKRQVVTSLKKVLAPPSFLNKKLVFCVNLKPSKFRGELSEAMILGVDHDNTTTLLEMSRSSLGDAVLPEGMAFPENFKQATHFISFETFSAVELTVKEGTIVFNDTSLRSSAERVVVKNIKNGTKVH
ncbi:methionine--tRNA ligase [Candidatus Woesearchaeota archaeon]|nr:methionine--tRNA ligase [Candidatus Woesearchaeota archaeon]